MRAMMLNNVDISTLETLALSGDKLRLLTYKEYKQFSENQLKLFMWKHGFYFLPTKEVVDYVRKNFPINYTNSIEIGAGKGFLGDFLNIRMTDSKLQAEPEIIAQYKAMGQPPIVYPERVIKLEASLAIKKFKPSIVVGSFITHKFENNCGNYWGVNENDIIKYCDTYIMFGNRETHAQKIILSSKHEEIYLPELIMRSSNQSLNRIFVWKK